MKTIKKNEMLERVAVVIAYVAGIGVLVLQYVHFDNTILKVAGL